MIFQLHLEKQSYDKAVDDIKNVFNLLRIQMQKIQEAMGRIRRNALDYSVKDYEEILLENLETISDTKQKFKGYRDMVKSRAVELEEKNRELAEENERQEIFLRSSSHQLKTPIAAALLLVDGMLNERLLGVLSTKENVNLETLGFENIDVNKFQAINYSD